MERTQLYISTVAAGCDESARRHGLGLEIAEYCTAANLDRAGDIDGFCIHIHFEYNIAICIFYR